MFGENTERVPLHYCHCPGKNDRPVYVGVTEDLTAYLKAHPDVQRSLNVVLVEETRFVAWTVDKDRHEGEKAFHMHPGATYALHTRLGGG